MISIAFVCNHLYGGGAERVLVSLANYFDLKGYRIYIIVFNGKERYPINSSIEVVEIGDTSLLMTQSKRIRKEIKRIKPNIIISFEYFVNLATIIAARNIKSKVIVSERNDPSKIGSGFGKNQLRNYLYRYCDTLVCQTPDAKAYFPTFIQKHSVVIPNPIKDGLPKPWKSERNHQVVNFCRLNEQKNLKLLVDAFSDFHKEYSDYSLVIYGDGPEKDNICNYINNKGMGGYVELKPNAVDIHEKILKCAMFVSSSDYEGLSNSMLEAMAIGLPTICTDCPCGGARMIISSEKNGLLVPVGDKTSLVQAMKHIAKDVDFASSISICGSELRKTLSIERIAKQWEVLFGLEDMN